MITAIRSRHIVQPQGLFDGFVYLEDGKILAVTQQERAWDAYYDFGDNYVAPGFIDLHTHGGNGVSFAQCSEQEAVECCRFHRSHGTTTLLPTFSAAPMQELRAAAGVIARVIDGGNSPVCIPGVHLEGPYLSPDQAGAQRPSVVSAPVKEEYEGLIVQYGRYIARWTYAPERDRDLAFTDFLRKNGIVASAGHTNARYEELVPAFERGCRLITHLYSCTSTVVREQGFRHLGVIEAAWLLKDLDVEIIADGVHLPPELIRLILQIKGREHVALCTDSLPPAGLEQKEGVMSGTPYIVEDGVAKLTDRSAFAGSIATADRLVRVLVADCGVSVADAVYMMSATPARIMGLNKGRLEAGRDADLVVFDKDIAVKAVFVNGKLQ